MSKHLSDDTIVAIRDRRLPPGELAEPLRHLGECDQCRSLVDEPSGGLGAALDQPDDERHLDADSELFPFADGTADAATRELVSLHVEDCAMCRRELDDLVAMRAEVRQRSRRRRLRMLALAASLVLIAGALAAFLALRRKPVPHPGPPPVVQQEPQQTAPPDVPRVALGVIRNARWQRLVDEALARGMLPVSAVVTTIALPQHTLRGRNQVAEGELSPWGVVVESDRPWLSWTKMGDARYAVVVYDGDAEVASSGDIDVPRWQPPEPLRRGRTYVWQVKVRRGDQTTILPAPPAPQAMFHVLDAEGARELAAARKAHPDDSLLLAVLSARHGLVDEAKRQLRLLRTQSDYSSPDVRRLVERELAR